MQKRNGLLAFLVVVLTSIAAVSGYAQNVEGIEWKLFTPGSLPEGKALADAEAAALVDNLPDERLYLIGQFVVTASGANRAVLRTGGPEGAIRVVVEFPREVKPPAQGTVVARDKTNGFLITDMRRSPDGTVTIYVREIGKP